MGYGGEQIEELKVLIGAFAAELDTPTMPYINEGLGESVVLTQMSDADRAAGKPGFALGSSAGGDPFRVYDVGRAANLVSEATQLKRGGDYLSAAAKIIESFRLEGHYDLVTLRNLWKTALCGGDAAGAVALIRKAVATYDRYETARRYEQLPYPPHDDLADVLAALATEGSCKARLTAFSGNPGYVLPRPYRAILADLQGPDGHRVDAKPPLATDRAKQGSAQGGCYVATAVYGSYDCPEVWVLRRWRDDRLASTAVGRRVIRVYYGLSPAAVRLLGGRAWFTEAARRPLDGFVGRLRASGYSSGPYSDR